MLTAINLTEASEMKEQSPKITITYLGISAVASIIVSPWAKASDSAEQTESIRPQLIAKDQSWSLRLPKDDKVIYRGDVNFDTAGTGSGTMMYPAPNAVGLFAGIITHGLLVESTKRSQKNDLQEAADKVLVPYQTVLSAYRYKDLMERGLEMVSISGSKKLIQFAEKPDADWLIESMPLFSITQDQSAVILDNSISIHRPGVPSAAAYQFIVRIVSQAKDETDLTNFWTASEGARLKEESGSLFAQSLDIALGELASGSSKGNSAYKTIRYRQGTNERIERGQVISERCNRVVIRTLRGWLMSVPAQRSAPPAAPDDRCGDASGSSRRAD